MIKFSKFNSVGSEIQETSKDKILEAISEKQMDVLLSKDHNVSILDSFSKNYSNFLENVKKVDYFLEQFEALSTDSDNVKKIDYVLEQVESLTESVETSVKREELEVLFTSHLLLVNESIHEIKESLSGINERDVTQIASAIDAINNKANDIIEYIGEEFPKHNKKYKGLEFSVENRISTIKEELANFSEISNSNFEVISERFENLVEEVSEPLTEKINELTTETQSTLSAIDAKIKLVNKNIKENVDDLSKFKYEIVEQIKEDSSKFKNELLDFVDEISEPLTENVEKIADDAKLIIALVDDKLSEFDDIATENKRYQSKLKLEITEKIQEVFENVKTVNGELVSLEEKYDTTLHPAVEKINVFEKTLSVLDSTVTKYGESVHKAKEEIRKVITEVNAIFLNEKYIELDNKAQRIEEIFDLMVEKELLLKEYNEQDKSYSKEELAIIVQNAVRAVPKVPANPNNTLVPNTTPESNFKAVAAKLRYLEQTVSQLAYSGMGSGEVNLRWLDDVDNTSIADGLFLKYDGPSRKFVFATPSDIDINQIQSDWNQTSNTSVDYIKNKPILANVAISGSYNDLSNKPLGIRRSINNVLSNYNVVYADDILLVSGNTTITLLTAASYDKTLTIKNIGPGKLNIIPSGSQTIDSYANLQMTEVNSSLDIISNGSNWYII